MSLITPDFGLLFWMVLIFGLVFFILAKFGFPVITGMVDKRNEHIESSLRLAQEAEEKISSAEGQKQEIIQQAMIEHSRILKEAAQTKETIIAKARSEAQEEAAKIVEKARIEINAEKESALREVRQEVAMLSVKVAEMIIRENLTGTTPQMHYIDKMIDEFNKSNKLKIEN